MATTLDESKTTPSVKQDSLTPEASLKKMALIETESIIRSEQSLVISRAG